MNIKYRREKRARNLLYLIVAIIWMSSVFIGWWGIVQINKRCTIVLFGKVATQSELSAEKLLQVMRQPEAENDYFAGVKFLASEGYGDSTINFLTMGYYETVFIGLLVSGTMVLILTFLGENRRNRQCSQEHLTIIAYLQQYAKGKHEEIYRNPEFSFHFPDTIGMWNAIQDLISFIQREQQQLKLAEREIQTNLENISHQMKTPLTGIQLYLEVLQGMTDDLEAKKLLESCHDKIEQLQQMVIALLHLAKLKAGKMQLNIQRISIMKLTNAIIEEVQGEWEKKNLSVLIDFSKDVELVGDEFWIRQAMINVLRNSIQHTPAGGSIIFKAWEENESAILEIEDTGSGILVSEREKVFERFFCSENKMDEKISGNGVGLNLARQIMERMGGSLQIKDNKNGTCMRFCFHVRSGKNKERRI